MSVDNLASALVFLLPGPQSNCHDSICKLFNSNTKELKDYPPENKHTSYTHFLSKGKLSSRRFDVLVSARVHHRDFALCTQDRQINPPAKGTLHNMIRALGSCCPQPAILLLKGNPFSKKYLGNTQQRIPRVSGLHGFRSNSAGILTLYI